MPTCRRYICKCCGCSRSGGCSEVSADLEEPSSLVEPVYKDLTGGPGRAYSRSACACLSGEWRILFKKPLVSYNWHPIVWGFFFCGVMDQRSRQYLAHAGWGFRAKGFFIRFLHYTPPLPQAQPEAMIFPNASSRYVHLERGASCHVCKLRATF